MKSVLPMKSLPLALPALALLAVLLSGCNLTLAADVTPPPGYQNEPTLAQTPQPAVAALDGPLYPLVPPNPADGALSYAEKCAPCHGDTGLGNGPQAAQLPVAAAALGLPEVANQATPAEWYRIVTQGKMDRFMPPFTSLSDRQRWDVVAYAFSLSVSTPALEEAATIYSAECATCHTGDFTGQEQMAQRTNADFYQAISEGVPPDMPAYKDSLSDAQRLALASYVRSLSFSGPRVAGAPAPSETSAPAAAVPGVSSGFSETATLSNTEALSTTAEIGTISGVIENASGGELAPGLEVFLHAFDQMQIVMTETTTVGPDGAYQFENVPMPAGRVFLTTVEYGGATYGSEIGQVNPGATALDLPISVYETTHDTAILVADRMHVFLEFLSPETLRVIELFVISNPTTQTLMAPEKGQPTIHFSLPQGATNLEFQEGELGKRYVQTENGFADTAPVRPGSNVHEVVFAFEMPYDRKLDLAQTMNLPVSSVVVLVPEGSVRVKGENLEDAGTRPVQDMQYHMYNINGLASGEDLQLNLSGTPNLTAGTSANGAAASLAGSQQDLLFGLGALGLTLLVAGVWLYRRSQAQAETEEEAPSAASGLDTPDSVMDAILALDDQYKAGQLPEEAYVQRRAELKARLQELLG